MTTEQITIDPEFSQLIEPLDPAERQQLEANIVDHGGARDPLVVWRIAPEGMSDDAVDSDMYRNSGLLVPLSDEELCREAEVLEGDMGQRSYPDCRVRVYSKQALDRFGGQFTLRTKTTFGLNELDKIRRGDVDLLLYCWGNGETRRIREWFLIDLRVFAKWVDERIAVGKSHMANSGDNGDGTSWGAWWIHLLPPESVVQSGVGLQLHEDCLDIA